MNMTRLLSGMALMVTAIPSLFAQPSPGTVASLEFQTPKPGMALQYEDGRKQKAAWHKQQNDSQPLMVWETLSGEQTGTYIVGRLGQHWADFDKPSVPEQSDIAEYNKVIGSNVQSLVTRYYEYMEKMSNPSPSKMPSKYAEVIIFQVGYGKDSEFRNIGNRVRDAAMKTKWPVNFEWYQLANGGPTGTWVLVLPRDNWAAFENQDNVPEMLKDAFGQEEADSILHRFESNVTSETTSIIQFRPDLSYLPGK